MPSETCTIFENDERGYFRWLARHSNGYVLNTTRGHSAQMMVLHRAVCASIKVYRGSARPGGFTERETIKVCAAEIESLAAWAQEHGREDGNFSGECGLCRPRQRRMWAAVSMYTLHAAIRMVLEEGGGALRTTEIAAEVNRRGLYLRRDHAPVRAGQISARVRRYPHLFERREGLIYLLSESTSTAAEEDIRLRFPRSMFPR